MAKTQVPGGYIEDDAITTAKIADNSIQVGHLHSSHGITTNNIAEHTNNKYYTDARVDTRLAASKSANLFTTGHIEIGSDTGKLRLGTGADLRIYHNGTYSYIDNYTGDLIIQQGVDDGDILFKCDDGSGSVTNYFQLDGSVGITKFQRDTRHNDSVKANFGTAADLQIFHDSSNSYVQTATGDLILKNTFDDIKILAEDDVVIGDVDDTTRFATFTNGGAATLFHNGSAKLATTSTGVSVTGALTATTLTGTLSTAAQTNITSVGTLSSLTTSGNATIGGNATITGNLTVNGSQTVLNTATLDVEDKNITLNKGSGDTSSTADGAGITIQDAVDASTDATMLWDASNDKFTFSHTIHPTNILINDSNKIRLGNSQDLEIYHDGTNNLIQGSAGKVLYIQGRAGVNSILVVPDGAVNLYHNNSLKFETTSSGVKFTGTLTAIDNQSILLGTDSDFRIRHTGTHSEITDEGTGHLKLGASTLVFGNAALSSEYARIDSSGNLLVSQTVQSPNTVGISLNNNGNISAKRNGGIVGLFNRGTSDGEVISIRKDDTAIGTIGAKSDDLYIGTGDTGIRFNDGNDQIWPITGAGTSRDNAIDIGNSSIRFKDLHLGGAANVGGTISSGAITTSGTLTVDAGSSGMIDFGDVTSAYGRLYADSTGTYIGSKSNHNLILRTNNVAALTIDTSQNATFAGNVTTGYTIQAGAYKLGSTVVMNSSRDLTNIGTISSGAITSTGLNSTSGTVQFADASSAFDSSDASGYARFTHTNGSAQIGLFRAGGSAGGSYLGADSSKLLRVYNSSFASKFDINTSGDVTATGNIQHTGLTMTSGTDIDQLITATDSLTLSDAWQDTSISGTDLASGTYIVQVYTNDYGVGGGHYGEFYSGTMSWTSSSTNSTEVDEIILHRAGHAPNAGDIYLRTERRLQSGDTGTLMLQIRGSTSNSGASNYIFKFRRMI